MLFSSINDFTCIGGSRKNGHVGVCVWGGGVLTTFDKPPTNFTEGRAKESYCFSKGGGGPFPLFLLVKKHIPTYDFL